MKTGAVLCSAALLGAAVSAASAAVDSFGVSELYATAPAGKEWFANFTGPARSSNWGVDALDPWLHWKGDATYGIDGQGQLAVSGSTPRIYIYDPSLQLQWHSVEMTVYAMRVADDGTAYAGIVGVARTNHTADTTNPCDTRGYGARMRYDGAVDFDKETSHPSATAVASKPLFPGGMPKNAWIGYKHVVYDLPNGNVVNETWLDLSDGADGGTWTKVNSFEDDGANLGVGAAACKAGVDPASRLTGDETREGSETGKPNLVVYFRSTNVGANGLLYKKMSVREIALAAAVSEPPPSAPDPISVPAPLDSFLFRDLYSYPNPARRGDVVTIRLQTGLADSVDVTLYDLSGARIHAASFPSPTVLDDGQGKGPQYTYEYRWDGRGAGSGVYVYAVTARRAGHNNLKKIGKVALIR